MKTSFQSILIVTLLAAGGFTPAVQSANPVSFTASRPDPQFRQPDIVLQFATDETGAEWEKVNHPKWYEATPPILLGRAANYLREGLKRMTGKEFTVSSQPDLSQGIVLTLMDGATDDIRNDPEVQQVLKEDPKDAYAAKEAFFIRSERDRLLVVANTPAGLLSAVVELLESVATRFSAWDRTGFARRTTGGSRWSSRSTAPAARVLHPVPDCHQRAVVRRRHHHVGPFGSRGRNGGCQPLALDDRKPHVRHLHAGVPGHALQGYHKDVLARIKASGAEEGEGFLAAKIPIGPVAERPPASPQNQDWLWIESEAVGKGGVPQAWLSTGRPGLSRARRR